MTKVSAVEALRNARARIEDPDHWCEGVSALDADGRYAGENFKDAVKFCAGGALGAVLDRGGDQFFSISEYLNRATRDLFPGKEGEYAPYVRVNDKLGHEAVMQMYDRAIEIAEGEE